MSSNIYYKSTDKNMKCRGYQFTLGEWSEPVTGELKECANGYHFCFHKAGVYDYYSDVTSRVFECEVEDAILSTITGTEGKSVCRRIKLVKEVTTGSNKTCGDGNTGYTNTGCMNTGNRNTGDWNTGDMNTGNRNSGDGNTGDMNSGDGNSGNRNTGDMNTGGGNTGYGNSGHGNTGNGNTGYGNTGDCNTGDWNTGCGNAGNFSSGFFCEKIPVYSFGKIAKGVTESEMRFRDDVIELSELLAMDDDFDPTPFITIPNSSIIKIKSLHKKHIAMRKGQKL